MPEVYCDIKDCSHNWSRVCTNHIISISDGECLDRIEYCKDAKYRRTFWIATKNRKETSPYREKRRGKRILVDSHVFYTDDDDRYPDSCYVTEERTGANCGSLSFVREHIQKVMESAAELPDVMTYPERKETKESLRAYIETDKSIPNAAAVCDTQEVVRCKDCKHLMFSDCYGECSQTHKGIVQPDDFCGYGKRRDEE